MDALASFDQKPEAVIRVIAERQDQLSALEARLRAAKAAPSALDLEVRRLEKEARQRLGDLRAMLERNPEEARKALETILGGPLRFTPIETPEGKRYRGRRRPGSRRRCRGQRGACSTGSVPSGIRTRLDGSDQADIAAVLQQIDAQEASRSVEISARNVVSGAVQGQELDGVACDPMGPLPTPTERRPRVPDPHAPVRRHIEQAVRLAVNEQPDATVEGAVVGLLADAADLLWLSDPAGAAGGGS
ncbi:hypothetical protein WMF38_57815 [Sorangium sp. So ce118]